MAPRLLILGARTRQALGDALRARAFGDRAVSTQIETGASHRLVLAASSADEFEARRTRLIAALDSATGPSFAMAGGAFYRDLGADGRDRTACLFPGYGVRSTTLVEELLAAFPFVEDWLDALGGEPVTRDLQTAPRTGRLSRKLTGSLDAVMLSDLATWEVLRTAGIACDAMAGHSYGENAVLLASGLVTDFAALTSILQSIGGPLASDGVVSAGMLALPDAARPLVAPLLDAVLPRAYVALDNCPRQVVVWAEAAELDRLEREARARGDVVFRFSELGRPIHTPRFPIAADDLRARYHDLPIAVPRVPVWSAGTAAPMPSDAAEIRDELARQWTSPVRWRDLVRRMYDEGVRAFVEVGPGDRLSGFVRDTLRGAAVTTIPTNLERQPAVPQLLLALGRLFVCGHDLDWDAIASALAPDSTRTADDLASRVAVEAAAVLGLADADALDRDAGFFDLGLGSIGCLELAERLEARLGVRVPQTMPFDHPTVRRLAAALGIDGRSAVEPAAVISDIGGDIAVVGLGCRFPGADSPEAFWRLLVEGGDAVGEAPANRLDPSLYRGADEDVRARLGHGGFLDEIRGFDAGFFGISPREATALDPQQRLLLEVTWEALEHAAIDPRSLAGSRTGVFVGISNADYSSRLTPAERLAIGGYMGTGNTASVAAGRLSFVLGLRGPCLALDTACSSSLAAVHLACRSLRDGSSDAAIAGGVNLIINPETTLYLASARALSPTGRCRTFDASADGYVRGEGCGIVVLKRARDAARDGDRVLAVIRGSAMNHDGRTSGLTVPSGTAQEAVVREALADAGTAPSEIGYVEAHGTGTPLGDPIEVAALGRVFASSPRSDPVWLGSVKTNVGHLEAAAGVASLIKTVLQIDRGRLAPSLHVVDLNPRVDWGQVNLAVVRSAADWTGRRAAGISAFGMSGTNVHLVVSEPRVPADPPREDPAGSAVFALSAQSEAAVRESAARLADHLQRATAIDLAAVSRTLTLGRTHFAYRGARYAGTPGEAMSWLRAIAAGDERPSRRRSATAPRIAFLCTGQGAQAAGMGRLLHETEPVFGAALETCNRTLAPLLGGSLLDVMFANGDPRLHQTGWTQPALFAFEYAMSRLWQSWGVQPDLLAGHSVGEIAAACLAGVFSLDDALRLVAARGRLMQSLPDGGGMLAVELSEQDVAPFIAGSLSIAAINAPDAVVLSGAIRDLEDAAAALARAGVRHLRLSVSHAFHSALMDPILDAFGEVAASIAYSPPRLPLFSNLSGGRAGAEVAEPGYWVRHLRAPVRFADNAGALAAAGCDIAIEIGPGSVLSGLGARGTTGSTVAWIGGVRPGSAERATVLESIARVHERGAAVNWRAVHHGVTSPRAVLPTYPFERDIYWIEPLGQPTARITGVATKVTTTTAAPATTMLERLRATAVDQRPAVVIEYLQKAAGAILRLPADRPIDPWTPLDRAGLDSLMALQLSGRIAHDAGVTIPPAVIVDGASVESLATLILAAPETAIVPASVSGSEGPLSYGQRALWFLWMLAPESAAYNVSMRIDVAAGGEDAWRRAAMRVAAGQSALRTQIVLRDGEPVQRVAGVEVVSWASTDASGWSAERLQSAIAAAHAAPFDLAVSPSRLHWFATGPRSATLLVTIHHTACDAWSLAIIRRDLMRLAPAIEAGAAVVDEPPAASTLDFAHWQRAMLSSADGERLWEFWRRTLAEPRARLELPVDRPRPAVRGSSGDLVRVRIGRVESDRLRTLGRAHGATMFASVMTAFLALLYRWTRERDLVIATPSAGRSRPEFAGVVGYFVDPVVVRAGADGGEAFDAWLPRVNRTVRDALAHADMPFPLLVERLGVLRDASRSPLFDVSFNFFAADAGDGTDDLELQAAEAKFDLTLTVVDTADGLDAAFSFSTDLFDRATIERAASWFVRLIEAVGVDPTVPVDEVALETAAAPALQGRPIDVATLRPVHEQILAIATAAPESVAVVASDGRLMYDELVARASALADRLTRAGVQPDEPVGLCTERTTTFVIGLLGIMLADGAYVPLDPALPEPLRARMLQQAGARLLVDGTSIVELPPPDANDAAPRDPLARLAYVIFTSGSTGAPKGVAVEHRSLANYVASIVDDLQIEPGASHALVSTIGADLGHTAIFPALVTGGTLHVLDGDTITDRARFGEYLEGHAIDYLKIVPSHLAALVDERRPVLPRRAVFLGGEPTPVVWVERLRRLTPCRFFNHYGPTEATVGVMTYDANTAPPVQDASLPLDRAVANSRIWIVDAALRPVPAGVPGELLVSGPCVARGYINDMARTDERFVEAPGIGRAYRTGDVARLRADGTLMLLGREDGQVKLHGYRIEVAHVERVLLECAGVSQCVVVAAGSQGRLDHLEAWVVAATLDERRLREWAAERLPSYMLPSRIFVVDRLPLTSNGKLDRAALTAMRPAADAAPQAPARMTARDLTEERLRRIWIDVLGHDRITPADDFFAVGGHSLAAVHIAARVLDDFGVRLPLTTFFTHRTLERLALAVRGASGGAAALVALKRGDERTGSRDEALVCFPGAGGNLLYFQPLVDALDRGAIWGAQAVGLAEEETIPRSVEEAAAIYAAEIARRIAGPVRLLGHSFGALVAFEAARQLLAQGRTVAGLAVLDNPAPGDDEPAAPPRDWAVHIATRITRLYGVDLGVDRGGGARDEDWLIDRLGAAGILPPGVSRSYIRRFVALYRANVDAAHTYRPAGPLAGVPIAVYTARAQDAALDRRTHDAADDLGWQAWSTQAVTVVAVPGTHITMLMEPHVQTLADHLEARGAVGAKS